MNPLPQMRARSRCAAAAGAVLLFLAPCLPARAQTPWYSVTDLGSFADTNTDVNGITYFGRISGTGVTGGLTRAYLFDGTWTNLGTLGGTASIASGLNNARQVAGSARTAGDINHAFLWTPGGTNGPAGNRQMKDLGTLGGTESAGAAVNDSGQVAGYSDIASGLSHAFFYNGTSLVDVGSLINNFSNSFAQSVNASGIVVGVAYDVNYLTSRAFLYNGTTVSTSFIPLGGPTNASYALDVNDRGHVTGFVSDYMGGSFDHAFRYNGTTAVSLNTLGGNYSYGNAINNNGTIVGSSTVDAGDTLVHAFVAVSNTMVDLNARLDSTGAGWVLSEARAINDWGQIVGIGQLSGIRHAFLLTPTPLVTNVAVVSSNVLVTFTAGSNVAYTLQGATDPAGSWTDLLTNLTGNGTSITATNVGAAAAALRFYRVR